MRARKKKNLIPRLERCADYIVEKVTAPESGLLWLEIGCGKGRFVTGMAELYPENTFYALEKVPNVMVMAVEKAAAKELKNVKFIIGDAEKLEEICPPASVDTLFLNFSDPWPRNRTAKLRLTYRTFLERYKKILKPGGTIAFKTDNKPLFDFSVEEFKACGFEIYDYTEDLHNSGIENPVVTEYEQRFSDLGQPIYHVKARLL